MGSEVDLQHVRPNMYQLNDVECHGAGPRDCFSLLSVVFGLMGGAMRHGRTNPVWWFPCHSVLTDYSLSCNSTHPIFFHVVCVGLYRVHPNIA